MLMLTLLTMSTTTPNDMNGVTVNITFEIFLFPSTTTSRTTIHSSHRNQQTVLLLFGFFQGKRSSCFCKTSPDPCRHHISHRSNGLLGIHRGGWEHKGGLQSTDFERSPRGKLGGARQREGIISTNVFIEFQKNSSTCSVERRGAPHEERNGSTCCEKVHNVLSGGRHGHIAHRHTPLPHHWVWSGGELGRGHSRRSHNHQCG